LALSPSREAVIAAYEAGRPQVLTARLVADLETPVSAYLKLTGGAADSFLLESVEGGAVRGRYTIIGFDPDLVWRCFGASAEIARRGEDDQKTAFEPVEEPALASLRRLQRDSLIDLPEDLPPMAAGLVGYMGYDTVRQMERLGPGKADPNGAPTALFLRPRIMAVFDSVADRITLITPIRPRDKLAAETAYAKAQERLEWAMDALARPLPRLEPESGDGAALGAPVSHTGKSRYLDMVERAKAHIRAGDIFQVVLAQRFSVPFELPAFHLYRSLRRLNPSPFLYFLNFADFALVGSSPEILVRLRGGEVTLRPIAGTRPRGQTAAEDAALAEDLLSDPKELAEHLMLLDLGRNDVGRVARPGTLRVSERNSIERYSHVMHIVSNVTGELDAERFDALSALEAGFPAGTVSGAPKIRAMEIIDSLEAEGRGPYAGAVGYFAANGSMDTCIVLRTAMVKDSRMHVHAGAGIVADSDPEAEYKECENKARALVRAAEDAVSRAGAGETAAAPSQRRSG